MRSRTLAVLFTLVLVPAIARAECAVLNGKSVMAEKLIEVAFSGRAVEVVTGDFATRTTFEVERVWKGSVPKRFTVYVWNTSAEMPRFEKDQHAVVLAHKLTDASARKGLALADPAEVVFTPVQCSDAPSLSREIERELGAGYPPKAPRH